MLGMRWHGRRRMIQVHLQEDWNSGQVIKLDKVTPKDFNKWLSKVENEATKETKAEMFGDAPPKETKDLEINQ